MTPSKLFTTTLFFLFIISYIACKKSDSVQKTELPTDRFFTVSSDVPKEIKAIAQALKKQNDKYNYLSSIKKKAGYPRWDKARIVNFGNKTITGRGSDDASGEIVYVPFVRDSENYVNSLLAVKMDASDTVYRMLHDYNYRKFGYDTTDKTKWSARDVFNLFTSFDNSVFGHTKFIIGDGKLFGIDTASGFVAELLTKYNKTTAKISLMEPVEICETYTVCPSCDAYVRALKENVLPGSGPCCNAFDVTFCTTYWAEVIGGGGGGSGDGGGMTGTGDGTGGSTGGGGGWYGGSDPCAGSTPTPIPRLSTVAPVDGCGSGWTPVPTTTQYDQQNINTLTGLLQQNPSYLVTPCNYLDQYLSLANNSAPQNVVDRLNQINQAYNNTSDPALWQYVNNPCYLQDINDASSAVVNFDYFPVHIRVLPSINGAPATAQQLFEYFRLNWNQFVDNSLATFQPYQDPVVNDVALWQSPNPTTAMLHLNMVFDGSVIVSQYSATSDKIQMAVKTVRTPLDGEHPVSGTRMWGISPDGYGGYSFYTSGSDRVTGTIGTVLNTWADRLPLLESGFEKADRLWTSLQDKMIQFITDNGGYAEKYPTPNYILRPQWEDVDLYLKHQISLDELKRRIGC
jgi:hypothetical protein